MPVDRKSPIRGVKDIKTHTGKIDHASQPYMAYMRISILEMEKARKNKEKLAAQTRIEAIDHRLMEIEREKADIQRILGDKKDDQGDQKNGCASENTSGFKIEY